MDSAGGTASPATQSEHPAFANLKHQIDDYEFDLNFGSEAGQKPPNESVYRDAMRYAHTAYLDARARATAVFDEIERLRLQALINEGIAGCVGIARVRRIGHNSELMIGREHELFQKRQWQEELIKSVKARRAVEEEIEKAQWLLDASARAEQEGRFEVDDNDPPAQSPASPQQELLQQPSESASSMLKATRRTPQSSPPTQEVVGMHRELLHPEMNASMVQHPSEIELGFDPDNETDDEPSQRQEDDYDNDSDKTTDKVLSSPSQEAVQRAIEETMITDVETPPQSSPGEEPIHHRTTRSASPRFHVSSPPTVPAPTKQSLAFEDMITSGYRGTESPPAQPSAASGHATRETFLHRSDTTGPASTQRGVPGGQRRTSRKRATSPETRTDDGDDTRSELATKKLRITQAAATEDGFVVPRFTAINQQSRRVVPDAESTSEAEDTIVVAHPRTIMIASSKSRAGASQPAGGRNISGAARRTDSAKTKGNRQRKPVIATSSSQTTTPDSSVHSRAGTQLTGSTLVAKYSRLDRIPQNVQDLAGVINGIRKVQQASSTTACPGRRLLGEHKALRGEVSSAYGTLSPKGKLVEWYGDERLFTKDMWKYLTRTNHRVQKRM